MRITPIILAGGSGERLWPLSKVDYPKQFVSLTGGKISLFQEAILRVVDSTRFDMPMVICNEEHRFIVAEQLRSIGQSSIPIILEPAARNTAPAVALAALQVQAMPQSQTLLVMPSDHMIADGDAFFAGLARALPWAEQGKLVTFGITPNAPETGYGYIQCGHVLEEGIFTVAQFAEKPSRSIAQSYLDSGGYVWNSGIFLFNADIILNEMAQHSPDIFTAASAAFAARTQAEHFIRPERAAMESCPSLSIDYAVMEHTKNAAVMPLTMGWCDLGSWAALHAISEKDAAGNTLYGNVIVQDTTNCHIRTNRPLIAAIGLSDLIVVAADNAVLIASHDKIGEIKTLMRSMVAQGIPDTRLTSFSHRPWGSFYGIDQGERYQVKRLVLKPGGKISLQTHTKRAEHWVVVNGIATVTNGDTVMRLSANESTYIPAGTMHRLENRDEADLIVIEVQTGSYLGEDDIERYDDIYQRT